MITLYRHSVVAVLILAAVALLCAPSVHAASIPLRDAGSDMEPTSIATDTVRLRPDTVKGAYIFVPDSILGRVRAVIAGKAEIKDKHTVDLNEKVFINGDSVPLIIPERNLGRFHRGLFNYLYIPKGVWQFGLTASYGEFSSADFQLLDLITDLDFSGHTFSIRPYLAYFVRSNFSVGMRLGYTSAKGTLAKFAVDFDEDLNFDISDVSYDNESYTAAIFIRHYIGLGRNSRFGVFNEVELAFSSGNSNFSRRYNDEPKTTHTTYMDARLQFSPGVSVLIMKNVSFNVSFGVFGYYLRHEKQSVDGVHSGSRFRSGANFKFNIFNINFGVAVQI